jgi:hypothetical protein
MFTATWLVKLSCHMAASLFRNQVNKWRRETKTRDSVNVGYRISLKISVRYRNTRQIFRTLVRYRKVRQQLSPISLIMDSGLSAHLWVPVDYSRLYASTNEHILFLCLKGRCHEIFDLRIISSNNSIWALDPRVKAFLHMASRGGRRR